VTGARDGVDGDDGGDSTRTGWRHADGGGAARDTDTRMGAFSDGKATNDPS